MDFLDPQKKRAHQIRLFIGYALFAVLICTVTLLLVFQAYGYNFNLKTGDITQNGLLFVDAHPEAANINLNGEDKGQTDKRISLPAGEYDLELSREGYRSWRRRFVLDGGRIERLVYPFLFPEKLESNDISLYAAMPHFASQSPDRRWLITQAVSTSLKMERTDLNADLPVSAIVNLPNGLFAQAGKKHSISLVEWASDNRHLLVKHTYDKGYEFVLIDHQQPTLSVNLSQSLRTKFTSLTLRDKKFDQYYLYDSETKTLNAARRGSNEVTNLLNKVLQFRPHGSDVLLFVTTEGASKGHVLAKVLDDRQVYTLKELPEDSRYLLDVARFNNKWYMAVGAVSDQRIYVLRDPVDALRQKPEQKLIPATTLRTENPQYVSFSQNARFIAVQAGSQFVVHDAETERNYRYDIKLPLLPRQKATWMDGHRLTLISKDRLVAFDFDGINQQTLSAAYAQFLPYFNRDYTAYYTIAPSLNVKGRSALIRTELLVVP